MQAAGGTAIAAVGAAGRRARLVALAYALGVIGVVADQVTKTLALAHLDPVHPPVLLGGLLTLQLTWNPGAAFSMGESFTVVLALIASAAFVFVAGYLVPRVRHVGWAVAEGFLLAGIVGNLIDRVFRQPGPFRGHVVDFLQLPNFAIFNVADMFITAAAVLIVWFMLIAQVAPDGRSTREQEGAGAAPAGGA
nr:signal peptidase II [Propionibacterium sp.]